MKHTKHHHSTSKKRIFKKHQGRSNNNSSSRPSSSSAECHQEVVVYIPPVLEEHNSECSSVVDISKPCPLAQDEIALNDQIEAEEAAASLNSRATCLEIANKDEYKVEQTVDCQGLNRDGNDMSTSTINKYNSCENVTIEAVVCADASPKLETENVSLSGQNLSELSPFEGDKGDGDREKVVGIRDDIVLVEKCDGETEKREIKNATSMVTNPCEKSEKPSDTNANDSVKGELVVQLPLSPRTSTLDTNLSLVKSGSQTSIHSFEEKINKRMVSGGICQLVDESLGQLYGFTSDLDENVKKIVTRQARDLLVCHYFGNLAKYQKEFLEPASTLLRKFKRRERNCLLKVVKSKDKEELNVDDECADNLRPTSNENVLVRGLSSESCLLCGGWPLRLARSINVSLGELEPALLRPGDYYLCVRPKRPGAELVLKYSSKTGYSDGFMRSSGLKEHVINEAEFGRLFSTMEEGRINPTAVLELTEGVSDEQMTALLQHMLVSVEKGIKRMKWELQSTTLEWTKKMPDAEVTTENDKDEGNNQKIANDCCCNLLGVNVKDSGVQTTPIEERKDMSMLSNEKKKLVRSGTSNSVSSINSSSSNGDLLYSDQSECFSSTNSLEITKIAIGLEVTAKVNGHQDMISDDKQHNLDISHLTRPVNYPVLFGGVPEHIFKSQAAVIPGCRDRTGRIVVIVNCGILQTCHDVTPDALAQLLAYFHTVPRKELAARGFLILVDARTVVNETYTLLDEAFYKLEGCINGAVNTVVIWKIGSVTLGTETSPRKIPTPFPKSAVKFEVVFIVEEVFKVIKSDQLLTDFGGDYSYDHHQWIEFRKRSEPFTNSCRCVGKQLIGIMQEMKSSNAPSSVNSSTQSIELHKKFISQVFDDLQLVHLQQTAPETLTELEEIRRQFPNNHDFREAVERSNALYSELQRAVVKLVRLADKRLKKLEQCLQLRTLEEETNQVLSWLSKKGEETLNKHSVVANSLGGVKAQERDFEKFYFLAMRNIEKGNDLLEEATMLGQKGSSESAGMKELASSLKQHLGTFSTRLEEQREKLEDTSKCYQLLDKAYEWALEAMKFVSRLKMDQYMAPDQLSCLMKHLHNYLENHQPLGDETFVEMIELATKLTNERLLEQCKVAQMRCQETAELIRTRQQTLLKVKQQMEVDTSRLRLHQEQLLDQASEKSVTRSCKDYPQSTPLWTPFSTSTPCYPYARRRSVSGLPFNLTNSPGNSFFGVACQPSHKRHDSFGAKMLISEEQDESGDLMDSGLVCTDLSVHADDECYDLPSQTKGDEKCQERNSSIANGALDSKSSVVTDAEVVGTPSSSMSSGPTCGKKVMKRSLTWQFEDDSWDILPPRPNCGYGQLNKTLPHRGSAESIPSITENEDSGLNQSSLKLGSGYPPVPVNSHLHQRGSSLNLQFAATSMADLRPSNEQLKQRKTALLIMREMIQTERDYIKSMEYIIENYVPELLREDIPQALRGKRNVIFGNIEKIYEFHNRYFLQELEQCENSPSLVGQCFLYHDSQFYLYALYNKNKPNSDILMAEYGSTFFKSKQMELGDKMDLASYLLKPVQRMGKYSLLLKQLLKECSEKDPEYSTLSAAKDMVNFQLRHGNDLLAMDAIRECDVNLKEQGCLIRQDEFLGWQGKSRKCLRQVFLFEDLILFSKARRDPNKKGHDIYQYKNSFKMSDIGLTEQIGESPTKFEIWFRKRKISDTYTLQSPNTEIRQNWVQDISKLLWKQALRNREIRLAELSSMGVGNKPCLDIKPSQDQISDRSISISQLSKAPKFRNSIGSTPTDYLRNNKRPHSIISISSSSSGSSHSSTGPFFGALNLGFDPSDSPKSHHRSLTQQSQCSSESGIIPDISMNYYNLTDNERHSKVERSNSNTSNDSIGACSLSRSPSTPMSPEEEEEDDAVEVESTIETVD